MLLPDAASAQDFRPVPAPMWPPPPLVLRPPRQPVRYEAISCWETYASGDYQTSTITKQVALSGHQLAGGRVELDFQTSPPVLTKPEDLESLETLALRLAALYARVVVEAAPTGAFEALGNHAALRQTWEQLARSLQESTTAEDRITPTLIAFMGQQLQDPARVLASLGHDYLYAALVPDFYAQPLGGPAPPARTRAFSQFFDKLPLVFSERVQVLSAVAGEALSVECYGQLDAGQTDVAAIGRLMAQAVGLAADAPVAPRFHYQATHVLDPATGLPLSVELTVYGRLAERYNKQYTLTLTRV